MALLPTGFVKSLIYQPLSIVSKKLGRPKSGKAIIVIVSPLVALVDDQVKEAEKLGLCAAQLGVHNDPEIMEGNFSLIFGSPESWILNPKWWAMLASTLYQDNLVAVVIDEAHVAYKWWVCINGFGYWLQVNLVQHQFEAAEPTHNRRHNQTLCDWLTGNTKDFKLQTSAPPTRK